MVLHLVKRVGLETSFFVLTATNVFSIMTINALPLQAQHLNQPRPPPQQNFQQKRQLSHKPHDFQSNVLRMNAQREVYTSVETLLINPTIDNTLHAGMERQSVV